MYSLPRDTVFARNPLARADLRCKEDTDYLRTAYTRLHAVQTTWLDRHADLLARWNSLQLRQENAARQVLEAER